VPQIGMTKYRNMYMDLLTYYTGEDQKPEEDGFIEPSKPRDEVRQEPYPLPKDFEWCTVDITDAKQVSCDTSFLLVITFLRTLAAKGSVRTTLSELC
jgi:hypothetical protein